MLEDSRNASKTNPVRKFINEPATKTINFFQAGLLEKEPGSLESSSSPSMAQNPPMGMARREYCVSPFCVENSKGPIPMANSFTRTPKSLAVIKCPNSWRAMRMPNMRIAMMMYSISASNLL